MNALGIIAFIIKPFKFLYEENSAVVVCFVVRTSGVIADPNRRIDDAGQNNLYRIHISA